MLRFQRTKVLIIPKILEYSIEQPKNIVYGVGLCVALFLTEGLKSPSRNSCWVVNQHTGVQFQAAASAFASAKLMQFECRMHITTGEGGAWD